MADGFTCCCCKIKKPKPKRRNKKRTNMTRNDVLTTYPAIIERVAEEQKETLEAEHQPESPLTHLYCTISKKAPVIWPAFLGDWAYNTDKIEGHEREDNFDTKDTDTNDENCHMFVGKGLSQNFEQTTPNNAVYTPSVMEIELGAHFRTNGVDNKPLTYNKDEDTEDTVRNYEEQKAVLTVQNSNPIISSQTNLSVSFESVCDILHDNGNGHTPQYGRNSVLDHHDQFRNTHLALKSESEQRFNDSDSVLSISVHRSYANGDSTSSVARRSISAISISRDRLMCANNEKMYSFALQNWTKERILQKMNNAATYFDRLRCLLLSFATASKWDYYLSEIFFLLFGITFLALCLNLPPTTFIFDILGAMFIKLVLYLGLCDT